MILEFRTKLERDKIDILNADKLPEFNHNSEEEIYIDSIIINWQIEFERREWGIKSMVLSVKSFSFDAYQDSYFDHEEGKQIKGFYKTFESDETWKPEIHTDNIEFDTICLEECTIDFETGEIDIY